MNINRIKKEVKRFLPIVLSITILCSPINYITSVHAEGKSTSDSIETKKEENVYANLNQDGSVDSIYVVNAFDVQEDETITDYGRYTSVKTICSEAVLEVSGNTITVDANQGKFYYQGDMESKEMPWTIKIQYLLDGTEIKADELAGKTGKLEMKMSLKQNKNITSDIFDNYLLQVIYTLDSEKCTNIVADAATIVNVGSDKLIKYNIMAGTEKDISIITDVIDYEMDGISITGVPMSFDLGDIDTDEVTVKVRELSDAIGDLDQGAKKLQDGVTELQDGTGTLLDGVVDLNQGTVGLSDGVNDLSSGVTTLSEGIVSLEQGSGKISNGADALKEGMSKLVKNSSTLTSGSSEILATMNQMYSALGALDSTDLSSGINQLKAGSEQYAESLNKISESNSKLLNASQEIGFGIETSLETMKSLVKEDVSTEKLLAKAAVSSDQVTQGLLKLYQTKMGYVTEIGVGLDELSSGYGLFHENFAANTSAVQSLADSYDIINNGIAQIYSAATELSKLQRGMKQLVTEYSKLNSGLTTYTDGFEDIVKGYNELFGGIISLEQGIITINNNTESLANGSNQLAIGAYNLVDGSSDLYDGVKELSDGTNELYDGTTELTDGTGELKDKTSIMDTEITDKINEMLQDIENNEFTPVSFTSSENEEVESVQFALKTERIQIPEIEEIEQVEDEPTFLERLFDLFK